MGTDNSFDYFLGTNINDDPNEIIVELSETEKNILYILGKMKI